MKILLYSKNCYGKPANNGEPTAEIKGIKKIQISGSQYCISFKNQKAACAAYDTLKAFCRNDIMIDLNPFTFDQQDDVKPFGDRNYIFVNVLCNKSFVIYP